MYSTVQEDLHIGQSDFWFTPPETRKLSTCTFIPTKFAYFNQFCILWTPYFIKILFLNLSE